MAGQDCAVVTAALSSPDVVASPVAVVVASLAVAAVAAAVVVLVPIEPSNAITPQASANAARVAATTPRRIRAMRRARAAIRSRAAARRSSVGAAPRGS